MTIEAQDLTITLEDGTELHATSSIELARKWAEALHGTGWQQLSPAKQSLEISAALAALNEAAGEEPDPRAERRARLRAALG